jgi:hypothetical protein
VDPALNCWILGWDASHLTRFLGGNLYVLDGFWDANIFYPATGALAYSEMLLVQAVQALPVYVLTGNPVLCYNLLFLSTFVLSGLGMYLLVRDLTGDPRTGAARASSWPPGRSCSRIPHCAPGLSGRGYSTRWSATRRTCCPA